MNEDTHDCQKILALLANRAALSTIREVIQIMQDLDNVLLSSDVLSRPAVLRLRAQGAGPNNYGIRHGSQQAHDRRSRSSVTAARKSTAASS